MPRGLRMVVGGELASNLHHEGRPHFTFVSPECVVLNVTCWCEDAVVEVPQWLLRYLGDTLSCGLPGCRGPSGQDHVVPPLKERQIKSEGYVSRAIARRTAECPEWARARRGRRSDEHVAERRDRVAEFYRQGLSLHLIASRCDVPPQTVRSDLAVLRERQVVA